MFSDFFLLLRALALGLSFMGLCMLARVRLKLHPMIAPCFVTGSIISVLTLTGMAGALLPAFIVLYGGGFAALIYTIVFRREKPRFGLAALILILTLLLYMRLYDSHLYLWDDFSHWAVAAKFPLDHDALPNGQTNMITFQSYLPGTAMFIYYFCRTLGIREDLFLLAQNLMMLLMALPLFAHLDFQKNRVLTLFAGIVTLVLFKFARPMNTLMVDWALCFAGFGTMMSIFYYRDDPVRALITAVPGMIACVLIKVSGAFFAAWAAAALIVFAKKKRRAVLAGILSIGLTCALWTIYIRFSYSDAFDSPHAVSAEGFLKMIREKGWYTSLKIGWDMLTSWVHPDTIQIFSLIFAAVCVLGWLVLHRPRALLKAMIACLGVYASWMIVLYGMYLFSMPLYSAKRLAAFSRYHSAGLLYCMLLMLGVCVRTLREHPLPVQRIALPVCAALCLAAAPLLNYHLDEIGKQDFYADLFTQDTQIPDIREGLISIKKENGLPDDGLYVLISNDAERFGFDYFYARYDLNSGNLRILLCTDDAETPYHYGQHGNLAAVDDPMSAISDDLAKCDAVIICEPNETFEATLTDLDVTVYRLF